MQRKIILNIGKYLIVIGIILAMFFFERGINKAQLLADDGTEFAKAVVTEVKNSDQSDGSEMTDGTTQQVVLLVKSGKYKGNEITATSMNGYLYGAYCRTNTKVIVKISEYNGNISGSVYNYDRETEIAVLLCAFLALMWLIGGKKGINSIIALVFTFLVIVLLFIPLMYIGFSPFWSAVLAVILITVASIILIADISIKSLIAIAGTLCGVIISGAIAVLFGKLSHINGFNVEEIETLAYIGQNSSLNVGGMLFSGILIASMGAVMDVAMSVSTSLNEINDNMTKATFSKLFKSGMNIGRDMIGTMSNTLILAFIGSSLNIVMIVYAYSYQMHQVLNMYNLGIELMRGVAGTMGIILTVPFTSAIAAFLYSRKK